MVSKEEEAETTCSEVRYMYAHHHGGIVSMKPPVSVALAFNKKWEIVVVQVAMGEKEE